ncbi:MAG: nucleoside-diphosphate-sugar epimerase [Alphaproteobacteria bacterium]|jgi:nucleoside-diphosphate-sugar epimerase
MDAEKFKRLFCFGYGYSAAALTRLLVADGFAVAGTVRNLEKNKALISQGVEPFVFNGRDHLAADALDGVTHVLVSVPPLDGADPVLARCRDQLAALRPDWIGYLSTTGVYGNRDGAAVDEGSALKPTSDRARARVQAELGWLRFGDENDILVQVFRLAGIYGPGRSALDQLRAGTARRIDKPGHLFSRIHVDDIARTLTASIARPRAGGIYNVCDDEPAEPRALIEYGAALLGIDPPPLVAFADAAFSDMARSFWADNKRVDNTRIKRELGACLQYPTYREGLRAILAAEGGAVEG